MTDFKRREFLKASAAFAAASAAGGFGCVEIAKAEPITAPVVDRVSVRVLVDGAYNLFLRPSEQHGIKVEPAPRRDYRQSLHNQWGLSLYIESQKASEQHTVMVDFGYTPEALNNNIDYVGTDPKKVEALIVSHGHFDHYGGLLGFLDKHRGDLPNDLTLYAGGEDNFCQRYNGTIGGAMAEFGALDRREIAKHDVKTVLCESPVVIGHAFTTGKIKRSSKEKVLPNTLVKFAMADGLGCNASHYLPAEMEGKIVTDEHIHEHATCFNLQDKGLVVTSSCGHVGIVNSARQAMEVSGVKKIHALVGGFHLGGAPPEYLNVVLDEIKSLNPDVVIPMHCSGENFVRAMMAQMPDKLVLATTGARVTFGA